MVNKDNDTVFANVPPMVDFRDALLGKSSFKRDILELYTRKFKVNQVITGSLKDLVKKIVAVIRIKLE